MKLIERIKIFFKSIKILCSRVTVEEKLMLAASQGLLGVVKYLVKEGQSIHIGNDYPFILAAEGGDLETCEYLFEKGSDPKSENNLALKLASRQKHAHIIDYLKGLGCTVTYVDRGIKY